jgi:ParB family chromosome partitioning protein
MSARRRTLGRGLDALLSTPDSSGAADSPSATAGAGLHDLPVDLLERGRYQPRRDLRADSLEELADSIRAQGIVQPIVVRPLAAAGGAIRYEIIAGERRWRAAQLAGLQEIPAIVRDVPDEAAVAMALIENIQRENLNPLEEARALERLIDEFGMTHQQAAKAVGRSRAAVTNLLRLLDLSPDVKRMVEIRELEMGHARALLGISDAHAQLAAARTVVSRGLSVRETERLVKRVSAPSADSVVTKKPDPNVARLEADLGDRLGARVQLRQGTKGSGKLVISYNSLDELEGILAHIR